MAVCGIDLRNVAVKILGIHFSYNEKIKDEESFYNIVFITLAISKIVFVALLTKIRYQVVKELEKIQKSSLGKLYSKKKT